MSNKITLAIFFLLNVIFASSDSKSDSKAYILALQWPNTTCFMNGKTISKTVKNPKSFGIHGLWPSNSEQTSKEPFPKDGFKSLCPQTLQMEIPIYWPNMIEDNNAKLWSIEWNKHGRCSGFDICTYFWNTLGLFKTLRAINLVGELEKASKPVVVGNSYDLSTLSAAFKETLGGGKNDTLIRCAKIGEKYYLWEVHVYLDAKLTRVQPPEVARGCGSTIIFPSPI
ncbi:unnamed protein product [Lupinus luteus]